MSERSAGPVLVIVGAGGHGAEVAAYAEEMGLPLAGAFDDGKAPGRWHVTTVLGSVDTLADFAAGKDRVQYITAFGNNSVRREMVARIEGMRITNLQPFSLRHSTSWIGAGVEIAPGTLLAPGAVATTRARIGAHCIMNVKASVSHDCVVEDYCNINPGATICGDVQLGAGCYVGAGAVVVEKRKIGAWTVIGAGSVVTHDLPDGVTAVGVPARIIKRGGAPVST